MSESNTPLQNTTNSSRKEGREGEKDKNKQNKQKKTTAEHVDSALVSNHTEQHTKAVQGEENKEKTRERHNGQIHHRLATAQHRKKKL